MPVTPEAKTNIDAQRTRTKALAEHLRRSGYVLTVVRLKAGSLIQIDHSLPGSDYYTFEKAVRRVSDLVARFYEANPGDKVVVLWSMVRDGQFSLGHLPKALLRHCGGGAVYGYTLSDDNKEIFVATSKGTFSLTARIRSDRALDF
jgi:hypothetical protein